LQHKHCADNIKSKAIGIPGTLLAPLEKGFRLEKKKVFGFGLPTGLPQTALIAV
jgi:hypothetical protein